MRSKTAVILIGGNGFLGNAFRLFLQEQEIKTIVIGRRPFVVEKTGFTYFSFSEIDLAHPETFLDTALDYVIVDFAYASIPNTSFDNPVMDYTENLGNVIHYLNFGRVLNVKKYVYVSSGGTVYGNQGASPLREDGANFPIAPYGITKLACERYVHMYCEVYDVPGVIVRPGNIYGPGQVPFKGQGLVATVMASIYDRKPVQMFGEGEVTRDYVYIDDFCQALYDVLIFGVNSDIYNIGSGTGTSVKEMLDAIEQVTVPYTIAQKITLPARPFDIQYNILDSSKIKNLNNWTAQTDLTTGLKKTWEWIKEYMQRR